MIMKRAAAKKLIERYYMQLTSGCGESQCGNDLCASSQCFRYSGLDSNAAAAKALELFQSRSRLCGETVNKVAKESSDKQTAVVTDSVSQQPSTSDEIYLTDDNVACSRPSSNKNQPLEVEYLTEQHLNNVIESCRQSGVWARLVHVIGSVFIDPEALMYSFITNSSSDNVLLSKKCEEVMVVDEHKDLDSMEMSAGSDHDADDDVLSADNGASSRVGSIVASPCYAFTDVSVDIAAVRRAFTALFSIPDLPFQSALVTAVQYLARTLDSDLRASNVFSCRLDYVNIFIIIMEIPALDSLEFLESAMPQFCKTVGLLPVNIQAKLVRVWSTYTRDRLKQMVSCVQQLITVRVVTSHWPQGSQLHDDECITGAARLLKILYYASVAGGRRDPATVLAAEATLSDHITLRDLLEADSAIERAFERKEDRPPHYIDPLGRELAVQAADCREPLVAFEEFVNESLSESIEMDKDYTHYRAAMMPEAAQAASKFSFMLHPFLLTTAVKNLGLFYDNRIRMISERRASILQNIYDGGQAVSLPYLRLHIQRDQIVNDALVNLELVALENPQDFKKQLFVEFEGEQGIDEGGVSKEFFQLIVEELFNPDIGMFTYMEETQTFWFNPSSYENDRQFMLIGIVLGLAIYNNVILDVHFPMVVYRKLMGKLGTFEDLIYSHPTLAQGLQGMLDYNGDIAEAFLQPFTVAVVDVFGVPHVHNLKENGDEMIVTNDTAQEFVELYADFLLNKSVEKQFSAFRRGFQMVTNESPLQTLFHPSEIELLVCGSTNFDFQALEEAAGYDGGFTARSTTIRYFWEIVHEFTDEQKKQLLQFATGSDRVPIGGLSKLKLIIARNGPDSNRLPTSHTCFNVLLLPDYNSKDKLHERLLKAITNSKGFGML